MSRVFQGVALLLSSPQCAESPDERSPINYQNHGGLFPLPRGLTPLHLAVAYDDLALTALLTRKPSANVANFGVCQKCHKTPGATLELPSLRKSSLLQVRIPLCFGCMINAQDTRGYIPLSYACSSEVVQLLLKHPETNLRSVSNKGETLLHVFVANFKKKPSPALRRKQRLYFSEYNEYSLSATLGERDIVGPSSASTDGLERLRLILAAFLASSVGKNKGDCISFKSPEEQGAEQLKKRKQDLSNSELSKFVNSRDWRGWTALHVAAARGYTEVCSVRTPHFYFT